MVWNKMKIKNNKIDDLWMIYLWKKYIWRLKLNIYLINIWLYLLQNVLVIVLYMINLKFIYYQDIITDRKG